MRLTRDFGESRMREIRTSGSTRGRESGGHWLVPLIPCFPLYSTFIRRVTSFESVFRAQGRLQTFKISSVLGAANLLPPSRKNFGRFPPPVLCMPVSEGEVASQAVPIGRQVPPSVVFAQDPRPAGRGHAVS